jgi:hypothetical protein
VTPLATLGETLATTWQRIDEKYGPDGTEILALVSAVTDPARTPRVRAVGDGTVRDGRDDLHGPDLVGRGAGPPQTGS